MSLASSSHFIKVLPRTHRPVCHTYHSTWVTSRCSTRFNHAPSHVLITVQRSASLILKRRLRLLLLLMLLS